MLPFQKLLPNNTMKGEKKLRIAIFGSGMGSNAKKIIEHFNLDNKNTAGAIVTLIISNKEEAGIVELAKNFQIPFLIINKEDFILNKYNVEIEKAADLIILAGFLLKIPPDLIRRFPNRIINIHPALLPLYGGKGMYGNKVHEAVLKNKDSQSGITIHFVDENYDTGSIIFQEKCIVDQTDSVETLANKIHRLEHDNFSKVIENEILKLKASLNNRS